MKKKKVSLLLALWLALSGVVTAAAADKAVLTITPDTTSVTAGTQATEILYTITLTPPAGCQVGVFSFQLRPSGQMTLPADFTVDDREMIAYIDDTLAYNGRTGEGIFSTYEYTPASGFFAAVGSTADHRMTAPAEIMTIRVAVPAGVSGAFVLDADFIIAPDGSGVTYAAEVETQPVLIHAPAGSANAPLRSGAVAVTKLTLPAAGEIPDAEVQVDAAGMSALSADVTWLCDGTPMASASFESGHLYTILIAVTAADGAFAETVSANEGFTVRRVDDTHAELSRAFRVEAQYTEAVTPEEAELLLSAAPTEEAPTSTSVDVPVAESSGGRGAARAALIVLCAAAAALGILQATIPGGAAALFRGRKLPKQTRESAERTERR